MDAPRDFLIFYFLFFIFSPNEQRAGGGGGGVRCQTFSFSFFPCSADHERDWPPCKVVFFGLATNALNVRNNNNKNNILISILRLDLVLTYGIRPEFRGGVHLFILNRHTPPGQSRVHSTNTGSILFVIVLL